MTSYTPRPSWWLAYALSMAGLAVSAHANLQPNSQPDPQEQARQQQERELRLQAERERLLRQQQEASADVHLDRPQAPAAGKLPESESPCFKITQISLSGEGAADFQWLLQAVDGEDGPVRGRCLGAQGVGVVMARMQNALVAAGLVTSRVLAAKQDLSQGHLQLTLLLGRVRQVKFAQDANRRATQWNALPARPGQILNLRDIEQGLENFKRVPTAEADIQITPASGEGAGPGDSDLLIQWQQGLPWRVAMSLDDSGSASSGKHMAGLTLSYDHWWTLNDLFYISFNRSLDGRRAGQHASNGLSAHYSIPYRYWLLAINSSQNDYYQRVVGAVQSYVYSGKSRNAELKLSRLLYRDGVRKLHGSLRLWERSSSNYVDDTEVGVQRRKMAGWELGSQYRQQFGAASLDLSASYRRGSGARGSLAAPEELFGEGSARPRIVLADGQINFPFRFDGQALRYSLNWRAQWDRSPLIGQDRFAIGGRHSVRGFSGEQGLSGERGWTLRNDVGMPLGASGQELYVGLDYGRVGGPSVAILPARQLAGLAFGLRGNLKRLNYDLFSGRPLRQPSSFKNEGMVGGFNLNLAL